jgi:hypothetical protein
MQKQQIEAAVKVTWLPVHKVVVGISSVYCQ